ncbi:collagen alpha-1(III) chain-like, partial [Dipodomys merriami]
MDPFPGAKTRSPRERRCQRVTSGGGACAIYGSGRPSPRPSPPPPPPRAPTDCLTAPRASPSPASPASPAARGHAARRGSRSEPRSRGRQRCGPAPVTPPHTQTCHTAAARGPRGPSACHKCTGPGAPQGTRGRGAEPVGRNPGKGRTAGTVPGPPLRIPSPSPAPRSLTPRQTWGGCGPTGPPSSPAGSPGRRAPGPGSTSEAASSVTRSLSLPVAARVPGSRPVLPRGGDKGGHGLRADGNEAGRPRAPALVSGVAPCAQAGPSRWPSLETRSGRQGRRPRAGGGGARLPTGLRGVREGGAGPGGPAPAAGRGAAPDARPAQRTSAPREAETQGTPGSGIERFACHTPVGSQMSSRKKGKRKPGRPREAADLPEPEGKNLLTALPRFPTPDPGPAARAWFPRVPAAPPARAAKFDKQRLLGWGEGGAARRASRATAGSRLRPTRLSRTPPPSAASPSPSGPPSRDFPGIRAPGWRGPARGREVGAPGRAAQWGTRSARPSASDSGLSQLRGAAKCAEREESGDEAATPVRVDRKCGTPRPRASPARAPPGKAKAPSLAWGQGAIYGRRAARRPLRLPPPPPPRAPPRAPLGSPLTAIPGRGPPAARASEHRPNFADRDSRARLPCAGRRGATRKDNASCGKAAGTPTDPPPSSLAATAKVHGEALASARPAPPPRRPRAPGAKFNFAAAARGGRAAGESGRRAPPTGPRAAPRAGLPVLITRRTGDVARAPAARCQRRRRRARRCAAPRLPTFPPPALPGEPTGRAASAPVRTRRRAAFHRGRRLGQRAGAEPGWRKCPQAAPRPTRHGTPRPQLQPGLDTWGKTGSGSGLLPYSCAFVLAENLTLSPPDSHP